MGFGPHFWQTFDMSPTIQQGADAVPAHEPPSDVPPPPSSIPAAAVPEIGGRDGLDPTRYGDWEIRGRCIDF
jgi:hypothetical protein